VDDTRDATGPTADISDGSIVSNHRIGSSGTVVGDSFVNDLDETMILVRYPSGIEAERLDDLVELGIFKLILQVDQRCPDKN